MMLLQHRVCLVLTQSAWGWGPASTAMTQTGRHCEIKYKKTQSQYTLYQECVLLYLISGYRTAHMG
eukprot:3182932-Rhodomonas_salina.1